MPEQKWLITMRRVVSMLVNIAAIAAIIFLGALYVSDSQAALEVKDSCLSCKKPNFAVNTDADSRSRARPTMDDWKMVFSPPSTEPITKTEIKPSEQQAIALDRVNFYRALAGLPSVSINGELNNAAQAHVLYNVKNNKSGHVEYSTASDYTGEWPWDRMKHFGYDRFTYATEVCSTRWASDPSLLRADPQWAIDGWIDTVYHRLPLLHPDIREAGFASMRYGDHIGYVMDLANPGFAGSNQIICYPVEGQTNVPVKFTGDESPDPLPGVEYPVGYPITVTFNNYKRININSASVVDDKGNAVACYKILPFSNEQIRDSIAIVPKQPLQRAASYRVSVDANADGAAVDLSWSFKTETTIKP